MDITAVELVILMVGVTPILAAADLFTRPDDAPAPPGGTISFGSNQIRQRPRSRHPTIRLHSHRI